MLLNSETLPFHGPNMDFAILPEYLDLSDCYGWPERSQYEDAVFFSWPDVLTDIICGITRSYFIFDTTDLIQHKRVERIYLFAANLLQLAGRIAACPHFYFGQELFIYEDSLVPEERRTGDNLKEDLIETLMFISNKIIKAAREKQCLMVVGI